MRLQQEWGIIPLWGKAEAVLNTITTPNFIMVFKLIDFIKCH